MKGNKQVLEQLNLLLADELTAISQYIIHSEMCANWGYKKLHDVIKSRAITEMKHAEKLIERILFLEEIPSMSNLGHIRIGSDIEEQFMKDLTAETEAIKAYNKSIQLADQSSDRGTSELLQTILMDEEKHADWLETQLELMKQVETKNYLIEQI